MLKIEMHTQPIDIPTIPQQPCAPGKAHNFSEFPNGWGCLNCSVFILTPRTMDYMTEKHPAGPITKILQPPRQRTEEDIIFDVISILLPIARSDISLQEIRAVAVRLITPEGEK